MMKKLLLPLVFIYTVSCYSQLANYDWGGAIGGVGYESAHALITDLFGNVIVAGYYDGDIDFDMDANQNFTLSPPGYLDGFITKYATDGTFMWAKSIDGMSPTGSTTIITSLITDASGNIYLTGNFTGPIDLDPGEGVQLHTSTGNGPDIFILKLDTNGIFIWGGTIGGTEPDGATKIAIDDQENLYLTGSFEETLDFDITDATYNLFGSIYGSMFVIKMDTDAHVLWGKAFIGGATSGQSLVVDSAHNVYVTGRLNGTTDFDLGPDVFSLSSSGNVSAIFVMKLDSNGDFVNAGVTTSVNAGGVISVGDIKLDSTGNIYIAGGFAGTVDFDFSANVEHRTSAGSSAFPDVYILKLDPDVNYVWVRQTGGFVNDIGYSMAIDGNDRIYVGGIHTENALISMFDADGTFVDNEFYNGSDTEKGKGIALDAAENLYFIGEFRYDFRNFPDILFNSHGGQDGFIIKLGNAAIPDPANFPPIASNDVLNLAQGGNATLDVLSNVMDSDGTLNTSSIRIVSAPLYGTLVDNGDGTLTYTHDGSTNESDRFRYTIADTMGATSNVATVTVSTTLGMEDFTASPTIRLYPNPTSAVLYLDSTIAIQNVQVFNMLGTKIGDFSMTHQIDLSHVSSGMYLLKITADGLGVVDLFIVKQ